MQQLISHTTHSLYSGDRAHWRDIPVTSAQPSPHHRPVVEDGDHVGWELDAEAAKAEAKANRAAAYTAEADPLFFKWQAGEGTEQEWLAKREEIRARFPYRKE